MYLKHSTQSLSVSRARLCLLWCFLALPLGAGTAVVDVNAVDDPQAFPYEDYLQDVALDDFDRLQQDRLQLSSVKPGSGDLFLCHLTETYMAQHPVSWKNLDKTLAMGESCFSLKDGVDFRANGVYRSMGHFILNKAARFLEAEMDAGRFHAADRKNRPLIGRLERHKIYLSVPETNFNKIIFHTREGNWAYLAKRLNNKSSELAAKSAKGLAVAHPAVYLGIGSIMGMMWLSLRSRRFLVGFGLCVAGLIPSMTMRSNLAEVEMLPQGFLHDNGMKIDQLQNEDGNLIGQALWLNPRQLQVNYLTQENVDQEYAALTRQQQVVVATTGGFTNRLAQPEGFTASRGDVLNASISPERHGLVLIDATGKVSVLDLRADRQSLPDGHQIANPIRSLAAYAQLLDWCRGNEATVFQTQLLVADNEVLVDPDKAVNRFRERRMLALVTHKHSGEQAHLMLNLTKQHTLAEATARAHGLANGRDFSVNALINLDVGLYDILNVYNESGQKVDGIEGDVKLDEAANLIVYSLPRRILSNPKH